MLPQCHWDKKKPVMHQGMNKNHNAAWHGNETKTITQGMDTDSRKLPHGMDTNGHRP